MTNVFHEIKRGFNILGFTGPLSSGCTTGANFFTHKINDYIENRTNKALPKIEKEIKKDYLELKKFKDTLDPSDNKTYNLQEKLKVRETLTVLSEYKENNYKYISMTEMLLKLTILKLTDNDVFIDPRLKSMQDLINYDTTKLNKVKRIDSNIYNRNLMNIDQEDIEIYQEFLDYIPIFYKEVLKYERENDFTGLLQDLGDNARRCGNPLDDITSFNKEGARTLFILAEQANNLIKFYRNNRRIEYEYPVYNQFVIEAFRNPYEVEYFRNRYYEFYLFSIFAPSHIRKERFNYNSIRDERDQGINIKPQEFYKQNVSDCVHLSDIAINNDIISHNVFYRKLSKYFALICRPGCIPPTYHELFMQHAYSMSVMSNCISRKVGAVIVSSRNYIIGSGWNDVGTGQVSCSLRRYEDIKKDNLLFPIAPQSEEREFANFLINNVVNFQHHSFCFKDEYSKYKIKKKIQSFDNKDPDLHKWKQNSYLSQDDIDELYNLICENVTPKRLEFCRALHAEENAILQNSILGGIGIEGSTLYTTTFPCELCAKKITQARIKKVVYTEPYPESISEEVFFRDSSHNVDLVQFEGVKFHSYYRLYKPVIDKKEFQIQERISTP